MLETQIMITTLYVTNPSGYRWEYVSSAQCCEWPGPLATQFTLSASDYDVGDDELVCPCYHVEDRPDTLGEMIEAAQSHLDQAHGGGYKPLKRKRRG